MFYNWTITTLNLNFFNVLNACRSDLILSSREQWKPTEQLMSLLIGSFNNKDPFFKVLLADHWAHAADYSDSVSTCYDDAYTLWVYNFSLILKDSLMHKCLILFYFHDTFSPINFHFHWREVSTEPEAKFLSNDYKVKFNTLTGTVHMQIVF